MVYISNELGNSLPRTQVSTGDLVISQRGSLGQCAIVDDTFDKLNISANIIAVKNIRESSAKFIHDYMLSSIGQALLERNTSGQVQQKVTTQDIADLIIPVNCDEEKLSKILDEAYNAYMDKLQRADELMDEMCAYILTALDIESTDYSTKLCSAVRLCEITRNFSAEYYHPERMTALHSLKSNRDIPVKKLSEIVDFFRDIVNANENDDKYLGLAGVESNTGELSGTSESVAGQAFVYRAGDVLYGRLRPYLNKVWFAENDGICSTEFHVMRVKDFADVLPEYLAAIMRSDLIVAQTKHMMTGNTHPRISNDDVRDLCIPIPNIAVQRSIIHELNNRRAVARKLKIEAEHEWARAKARFEKELLGE